MFSPTKEQRNFINDSSPIKSLRGMGGTGKTETLASLINQTNYQRIAVITLTNKAASNIRDRISEMKRFVIVKTFHGFAYYLLRKHLSHNLPRIVPNINDELIKKELSKQSNSSSLKANNVKEVLNKRYQTGQDIEVIAKKLLKKKDVKACINLIQAVQRQKAAINVIDFGDLLIRLYIETKKNPKRIVKLYPFIVFDEFQDSSTIQWKIIKILLKHGLHFVGAGDPYQSIYQFADASPKRFIQLESKKCKKHSLTKNFRLTNQILEVSNELCALLPWYANDKCSSKKSGPKPRIVFSDSRINALKGIIKMLNEFMNNNSSEIAVLTRTNIEGQSIHNELHKHKIPHITYLQKELSSQEKDILAITQICNNSHRKSDWLRLLQCYPNIGEKKAIVLYKAANKAHFKISNDPRFTKVSDLLSSMRSISVKSAIETLIATKEFKQTKQLINTDAAFNALQCAKDCEDYNDFASLFNKSLGRTYDYENTINDNKQYITVGNVHKIKGNEFKYVLYWANNIKAMRKLIKNERRKINEEIMVFNTALTRSSKHFYMFSNNTKEEWIQWIMHELKIKQCFDLSKIKLLNVYKDES